MARVRPYCLAWIEIQEIPLKHGQPLNQIAQRCGVSIPEDTHSLAGCDPDQPDQSAHTIRPIHQPSGFGELQDTWFLPKPSTSPQQETETGQNEVEGKGKVFVSSCVCAVAFAAGSFRSFHPIRDDSGDHHELKNTRETTDCIGMLDGGQDVCGGPDKA